MLVSLQDAPIVAVVIYSRGAQISRSVQVPANVTQVTLNVNCFDESTLRVSGRVVDVENRIVDAVPSPELETLAAQLKDLEFALKVVEQDVTGVESAQKVLTSFADQVIVQPKPDHDAFFRILEPFKTMNLENAVALAKVLKERERLNKSIQQTRLDIRRLNADSRQSQAIVITLAASSQMVPITVSYMVNHANWTPSYDIRVNSTGSLELTYKASISQSTGEDWNNVSLQLSTSDVSESAVIPTIDSQWQLDLQPNRPKTKMSFRMQSHTLVHSGISTMYEIPSRSSIPSDGLKHTVTVAIIQMDTQFGYATVPKLNQRVFLTSQVLNHSEYLLLPGPMAVYLDGNFIASSSLDSTISPLEAFEVSLGEDVGISVSYRSLDKQNAESGVVLFGNKTLTQKYTTLTTLKNNKTTPTSIQIFEQVPVSENDKIKVVLTEPALSSIATYDCEIGKEVGDSVQKFFTDDNVLVTKVSLLPGESKDIAVSFQVSYPHDLKVVGL